MSVAPLLARRGRSGLELRVSVDLDSAHNFYTGFTHSISDGGLFMTRNIWDAPNPTLAQWQQPDVGLATHLFYGIGTGDPTLGNPNLVFGGLQDNGTRWRLVQDESFIQEFNSGNWDQILGGEGLYRGAAVDHVAHALAA